jgi:hypothetical protein
VATAELQPSLAAFPWPQTQAKIEEGAAAAVALRGLRREIMARLGYSLRELCRTLEEPGANPLREAHTRLDTAVRAPKLPTLWSSCWL